MLDDGRTGVWHEVGGVVMESEHEAETGARDAYVRMTCGHWSPAGESVGADATCPTCGQAAMVDGPWVLAR